MFFGHAQVQNGLMVGNPVPEQTKLVESPVSLLTQKRRRTVDEQFSQLRTPEMGFVLGAEKAYPKPEAELRDDAVRLERFTVEAEDLLGPIDMLLLRMTQA